MPIEPDQLNLWLRFYICLFCNGVLSKITHNHSHCITAVSISILNHCTYKLIVRLISFFLNPKPWLSSMPWWCQIPYQNSIDFHVWSINPLINEMNSTERIDYNDIIYFSNYSLTSHVQHNGLKVAPFTDFLSQFVDN